MNSTNDRYGLRGVSSAKEEVHQAIKDSDKGIFPNAFCKILPDILGNDPNYCNIMHADGAGTKSSLAYMYWKETGDLSVWKGIAQDALVMNLDDLLCVGATSNILVSSTIGRNKNLITGEIIKSLIDGTNEFIESMRPYSIDMHLCGGETADVGDLVRTIIVDSTFTCRLPKTLVIDNANIGPGQVIVGLSSFGKTNYENDYNGGMGSNGLTSARHDVFSKYLSRKFPESYDSSVPLALLYSGKRKLNESIDIQYKEQTYATDYGKLVLSPTRTYAPVIQKILDQHRAAIKGMVHCSGGAQTKVLHFIQQLHVIKDNLFETPPLFKIIQAESNTDWKEMYRVFNMGHRMEIYTDQATAASIIKIAESFNLEAKIIGRCQAHNGKKVTIQSEHGHFEYTS
ncbi:MAG TPA: phosphoribosylformylglycinamidine cyclo-ligase [Bacteroidia bacterium]|nr:phosphoribosylformylglycinamidine cyclo-ligase [Bacteroidia bacterium]HNT80530.1 phosphoribosylformylglycinamidine cyclo-ligase [Bacteroidia bacterium]